MYDVLITRVLLATAVAGGALSFARPALADSPAPSAAREERVRVGEASKRQVAQIVELASGQGLLTLHQ